MDGKQTKTAISNVITLLNPESIATIIVLLLIKLRKKKRRRQSALSLSRRLRNRRKSDFTVWIFPPE